MTIVILGGLNPQMREIPRKKIQIKMGYFGSLLEPDQGKHLGTPRGIRRAKKIILKGTSDEAKLSVQQLTKPTDNIIEVDKDLS